MRARKKWRTVTAPGMRYCSHTSQPDAYRYVESMRRLAEAGMLRPGVVVTVQVNEGQRWETYEHCPMPAVSDSPAPGEVTGT